MGAEGDRRAKRGVFVQIAILLCKLNMSIKVFLHRKTPIPPPKFIDDNVLGYKPIQETSPDMPDKF